MEFFKNFQKFINVFKAKVYKRAQKTNTPSEGIMCKNYMRIEL